MPENTEGCIRNKIRNMNRNFSKTFAQFTVSIRTHFSCPGRGVYNVPPVADANYAYFGFKLETTTPSLLPLPKFCV